MRISKPQCHGIANHKIYSFKEEWGLFCSTYHKLNKKYIVGNGVSKGIRKLVRKSIAPDNNKHYIGAKMAVVSELTHEELLKRKQRKNSYHLVASNNRLPDDDDECDYLFQYLTSVRGQSAQMQQAKKKLLKELGHTSGDTSTPGFQSALEELLSVRDEANLDVSRTGSKSRKKSRPSVRRQWEQKQEIELEGMWIDLAKPRFKNAHGRNKDGDITYTLGRMSFGMYQPNDLVCSIKGTFNPVRILKTEERNAIIENLPERLKSELHQPQLNVLRSYSTVTAITIEPGSSEFDTDSPNHDVDKPIDGLMTTHGYAVPSEEEPNRLSVFWTGGSIEVADLADLPRWREVFEKKRELKLATTTPPPSSTNQRGSWLKKKFGRKAPAAITNIPKPPLKMEKDGRISYELNCNVAANVDLLYLDETLRIAKASSGTVYVFARVPHFPYE